MDLSKIKKIYMIGVKGVGMTMLAQYFSAYAKASANKAAKGIEVIGSDVAEKFMTDKALNKAGVKVIEKFDKNNIPKDADLIIYSTSYNAENNVEVAAVINPPEPHPQTSPQPSPSQGEGEKLRKERGKFKGGKNRVLTYAEALGGVFNQKYGIAVVGSHGKTTATAWLGFVLEKAGLSPSVMVGSFVPQFDGFSLAGKSDYLVIEADEYQNKLQFFNPKGVLLNNIDYDHPDFFPTEEEYKNVFIEFIKKIPKSGFLVANFDDPIIRKVANVHPVKSGSPSEIPKGSKANFTGQAGAEQFNGVNCKGKVISYAINEAPAFAKAMADKADYVAYDIRQDPPLTPCPQSFACDSRRALMKGGQIRQYFKVKLGVGDDINEDDSFGENNLGDFSIGLSGKHNISNALAVIAACVELGVELVDIRKYLSEFTGTARRMEIMGEFYGATIIDDYAHHPTEIKATLAGAREMFGEKKIKVVFHPHTFTRTKALLDDFAKSFDGADEVIVLDIYGSAREKQGGVHSTDLVRKLKAQNSKLKTFYISTLKECEEYLRKNIEHGDVVILMGAGDVFRVGEKLVSKK